MWSIYLFKMIVIFINIFTLTILIFQVNTKDYLFKMFVNFINTLDLTILILQVNMKDIPV